MKNLDNKSWGDLTLREQEHLLSIANAVDLRNCCKVEEGECAVNFEGYDYSIAGEVIDDEIIIEDDAMFYHTSGSNSHLLSDLF